MNAMDAESFLSSRGANDEAEDLRGKRRRIEEEEEYDEEEEEEEEEEDEESEEDADIDQDPGEMFLSSPSALTQPFVMPPVPPFETLPTELLHLILSFLPNYMIGQFAKLCRRFAAVALEHHVPAVTFAHAQRVTVNKAASLETHQPECLSVGTPRIHGRYSLFESESEHKSGTLDLVAMQKLANISSLRSVTLKGCAADEHVFALCNSNSSLHQLTIEDCQSLSPECLHAIASMTSLRTIEISDCPAILVGGDLSPLLSCAHLTSLSVGGRGLSAASESLGHLTALTALHSLDIPYHSGLETLAVLSSFSSLRKLKLTGSVEGPTSPVEALCQDSIAALIRLTSLDVIGCFSDTALAHLSSLQSLRTLSVRGDAITDTSVRVLSTLSDLRNLSLEGTAITDVSALTALQQLTHLSSSKTIAIAPIATLTTLRSLMVGSTGLDHATSLQPLTTLQMLQRLDLGTCTIRSQCLQPLSALRALSWLRVGDMSALNNVSMRHIGSIQRLTHLILFNSWRNAAQITDHGIGLLSSLTGLKSLTAPGCGGVVGHYLGALTSLTTLRLDNSGLTNDTFGHLSSLTGLTDLSLQRCAVSGRDTIKQLWPLRHLTALNLSDAGCTGRKDKWETKFCTGGCYFPALRFLNLYHTETPEEIEQKAQERAMLGLWTYGGAIKGKQYGDSNRV